MIHILAKITAQPQAATAVREALVELVGHSRKEAGCVSYALYQRGDDPALFQTVEEWSDAAAADAHMKTPHIGAALAKVGSLLAAPPEIVRFDRLI
ncbi:MAG: antibiotic biosynthesis monooxygenase [Burkholderiaceae bacterium]|nr:MAG: antibiotic biosynthesis monooxygenase [Burkholderiaceae bacterium]